MARLKQPIYMRQDKRWIKSLDQYAEEILADCDRIFEAADTLDTAVREDVSTGLAYLLYSAYDSQACSLGLEGEAFCSFSANATAEWFRQRGFAEWFCIGAGTLFNASRPRIKADFDRVIVRRRRLDRKKKKKPEKVGDGDSRT